MTDISLTSTVLQQELTCINPHPVKRQVDMREVKVIKGQVKVWFTFKNCTCHFVFEEDN